ncbi:MAG TPA: hypothetical protein VFC41_00600 [Anaerovoracaceae bacterium]|nr:hypothetical protein [Anaerovoracaceae bacterium]
MKIIGLSCPKCSGQIPIPEGKSIVICPFCGQRSIVYGDHGILRYQVPVQVDRDKIINSLEEFLSGSLAIARDAVEKAEIKETFLVQLPFWYITGQGLGWGFGTKREKSGDHSRDMPKEIRVNKRLEWTQAACDVGEFGVNKIKILGRPLVPFNPVELHHSGMVFEPVGSCDEAFKNAKIEFENVIKNKIKGGMDEQTQLSLHIFRPRKALVYYPLWVLRYTYQGRAFQVVIDGYNGDVLFGKAPGNSVYRAAALVFGMALGSFLMIDVPIFFLRFSDDPEITFATIIFVVGLIIMVTGWRIFRYKEHFEYHRYHKSPLKIGELEIGLPVESHELVETVVKMGVLK